MVAIPTIEPDSVTAGDYIQWTQSFGDYRATDGWVLSYVLVNATSKITITATTYNITDFLVTVPAATSASWTAGKYKWQAYATLGTQRYTIRSGEMEVLPNFSAASTLDTRTHVKKVLDAIEAVIENRASLDQQSYEIEGRKLVRMTIDDLLTLRSKYRSFYLQEQNADRINRGEAGKNRLLVRF